MPYYPEEVIQEVRERNNIVDVIGSYIHLETKGSNYFGLCPFHNEKSPSFSVSESRQSYHCFGCGKGGNVFTFLMEYENYTFPEAVQALAERAGVQLPEREMSSEEKAHQKKREVLLQIQKDTAIFYYHTLLSPAGRNGLAYLRKRALTDETIKSFGLGYSPARADQLYRYLRGRGYNDRDLSDSGLFRIDERGAFDRFWNRVMLPIMDINNHVIGFGGRVMGDGEPKYLNSPETDIFDKSRNLFALNVAKRTRKPYMLVCEGYMDVITLHQAGFTNAVASLGTAFTDQHAQILKRYTKELILTFDSDGAGIKAALRAAPMVRAAGLNARVLTMKPYKDPDEFIKNMGAEAYQERIDQAQNSFLFEIAQARSQKDTADPAQRTEFINLCAEKLLSFRDPLERDSYVRAVSQDYAIDYRLLTEKVESMEAETAARELSGTGRRGEYREYRDYRGGGNPSTGDRPDYRGAGNSFPAYRRADSRREEYQNRDAGRYDGGYRPRESAAAQKMPEPRRAAAGIPEYQKVILATLAEQPSLWEEVRQVLAPEDFAEGVCRSAAEQLFSQLSEGKPDAAKIVDSFAAEGEGYSEAASIFDSVLKDGADDVDRRKALRECVLRLKKDGYEKRQQNAKDFAELNSIINEEKEFERKWNSPDA